MDEFLAAVALQIALLDPEIDREQVAIRNLEDEKHKRENRLYFLKSAREALNNYQMGMQNPEHWKKVPF